MTDFSIYDELMPKIQALISPPDAKKEKLGLDLHQLHPYFKRKGKRHNHDCCDACGEKGDILCCDICPASFHLLCHDPPLEESEIPSGQWFCKKCKFLIQNKKNKPLSMKDLKAMYVEKILRYKKIKNTSISTFDGNETSGETSGTDSSSKGETQTILARVENGSGIIIKEEDLEEQSISDTYASSDTDIDNNAATKFNSFENKILKIKTGNRDTSDDDVTEVRDIHIEDVFSIIGVNKEAQIEEVPESENEPHSSEKHDDYELWRARCAAIPTHLELKKVDNNLQNYEHQLSKENETNHFSTESTDDSGSINSSTGRRVNGRQQIQNEDQPNIEKAFSDMIRCAKNTNPRQFTLPAGLVKSIDINFAGTEKGSDSFPVDLDSNDVIKLPARKCYYCKGICVTGQMISCDFCPAHFHLNCLNLPVCAIPDVKWMCPLHPHHIMEKLVKTPSSLTEQLSWWNKLSAPVNDDEVKSNFMKKVKSLKSKTSVSTVPPTYSTKIPNIVKYHYQYPSPRIPSLNDLLDSKSDCLFETNSSLILNSTINLINAQNDNEEMIKLSPTKHEGAEMSNCNAQSEGQNGTLFEQNQDLNSSSGLPKKYNLRPSKKKKLSSIIEITSDDSPCTKTKDAQTTNCMPLEPSNKTDHTASGFNFTSVGIYDNNHIPSKPTQNEHRSTDLCWKNIENFILRDINKSFITAGITETTLSEDVRRMLLLQSIKLYTQDLPPSFMPNVNPYPFFHPLMKDSSTSVLPERPKGKVRAVLCPLSHRSSLIYMYDHVLSIGSAFANDVCLLNYGYCNFTSEEHAAILYDKTTNLYELINYSEYCTVVDDICYTNNISRKKVSTKNNPPTNHKSTTVHNTLKEVTTPYTSPVKRKAPPVSPIEFDSDEPRSKKTGSTVIAAEARNAYKKLLHDIDKLVTKSQEEMTRIAEEDLGEISKAAKLMPQNFSEMSATNLLSKKKQIRRKKRKSMSMADGDSATSPLSRTKKKLKCGRPRKHPVYTSFKSMKSGMEQEGANKPRRTRGRPRKIRPIDTDLEDNRICHIPSVEQTTFSEDKENSIEEITFAEEPNSESESEFENEYCSTNDFTHVFNKAKCKCQSNDVRFPNASDSSWETAAPLYHGSYIRFGCMEFVFSIVNYPVPAESRPYNISKPVDPPAAPSVAELEEEMEKEPELAVQKSAKTSAQVKKDDLTLKLISLLNVLSSKNSAKSSSKSPSPGSKSSTPSSSSSRSASPVGPRNTNHCDGGNIEISHLE